MRGRFGFAPGARKGGEPVGELPTEKRLLLPQMEEAPPALDGSECPVTRDSKSKQDNDLQRYCTRDSSTGWEVCPEEFKIPNNCNNEKQ